MQIETAVERNTQVVLALQRLVLALGSESPKTHAVLLPALQYATDPAGPEALALLEDGLDTLLAALRCAPSGAAAPGLLALFPHLTAAMEQSTGAPSARPAACPEQWCRHFALVVYTLQDTLEGALHARYTPLLADLATAAAIAPIAGRLGRRARGRGVAPLAPPCRDLAECGQWAQNGPARHA